MSSTVIGCEWLFVFRFMCQMFRSLTGNGVSDRYPFLFCCVDYNMTPVERQLKKAAVSRSFPQRESRSALDS